MILSTERQLQLSMDSAYKINVPRHNKEKKLLELDAGASGPQITSDPYRRVQSLSVCTGRFIMFSVITNICNKKTKGPTFMELFTATGKLKKIFL